MRGTELASWIQERSYTDEDAETLIGWNYVHRLIRVLKKPSEMKAWLEDLGNGFQDFEKFYDRQHRTAEPILIEAFKAKYSKSPNHKNISILTEDLVARGHDYFLKVINPNGGMRRPDLDEALRFLAKERNGISCRVGFEKIKFEGT